MHKFNLKIEKNEIKGWDVSIKSEGKRFILHHAKSREAARKWRHKWDLKALELLDIELTTPKHINKEIINHE